MDESIPPIISAAKTCSIVGVNAILNATDHPSTLLATDSKGYTALHWAAYNDEIDIVQLLSARCPDMLTIMSKNGTSALHVAAVSNSLRSVRYMLQLEPCRNLIDCTNDWGETPIHVAAAANNIVVIEELLGAGANSSIRDKWNRSPHTVAKQNGYGRVVDLLVPLLSPSETQNFEADIISSAITDGVCGAGLEEELSFVRQKKAMVAEEFQRLLRSAPEKTQMSSCPPEQHIFRSTPNAHSLLPCPLDTPIVIPTAATPKKIPLSKLVEYPGDPLQVATLLSSQDPSHSIDPGGKDMLGYTALHKFASWDKVDLLELLLPYLSWEEISLPVGSSSFMGYSVLHLCVDCRAWQALEYLLKHCDSRITDLVDKSGKTFLELAREQGVEQYSTVFTSS